MSERSINPDAAPDSSPPWLVLDLDEVGAQVSEVLATGTVVLLVSAERDREWAAEAALQLSSAWAAGGRRIVLADLHLENPMLRPRPDGPELEGIVDIFLYGASLSRIAAPGPDGSYYLIPAGTYTPDSAEIYQHPRWRKLVAGFRDTQATLLLFVPAESPGVADLAQWSSEAILLGSAADASVAGELSRGGMRVLAVLRPVAEAPRGGVPGAAAIAPVVSAATARGGRPSPVPRAAREREGTNSGPTTDTDLPPPKQRRKAERGVPYYVLVALLLVVMLGAIVYLIAMLRPDLLPAGWGADEPQPPVASSDASAASREGELLDYSVQVKAFPSLTAAREQLAIEQGRVPETVFFISPEEIQGIVYYRILAGLATDSLGATRLRDRLVRDGSIEAEDAVGAWSLLQSTLLAFDLGEFETEEAANARADSLIALDIPSYPAAVPYSDGSRRWQLYGGAFRDTHNAGRMAQMLADAGIPAQITIRTGEPVTITE